MDRSITNSLPRDKQVPANATWEVAMKLIINDVRYKGINYPVQHTNIRPAHAKKTNKLNF